VKPLCIYHAHCADGFAAAWVVRRRYQGEVEFVPGVHGQPPPEVAGRDVIFVDFAYRRAVIEAMGRAARSILILDHHKSAAEDLAGMAQPASLRTVMDMDRSGAGLTWDHFFAGQPRPVLLDHVEDFDLGRCALPATRALMAAIFSYPYDFAVWDKLVERAQAEASRNALKAEGEIITRKLTRDVDEALAVGTRAMVIGGIEVPVVNLPPSLASEAATALAAGKPFAGAYFDRADARVFSLRSDRNGLDVAAIAEGYGGGGHRHAAGFQVPFGWEGDR
jgi:hypothetical protein